MSCPGQQQKNLTDFISIIFIYWAKKWQRNYNDILGNLKKLK